jgi:FlaA1/EpsC-like NDP-sugar epimerase
MRNIIRTRNFCIIIAVDICLLVCAYWLSYVIRFEGQIPTREWNTLVSTLPYIICFKLFTFFVWPLQGIFVLRGNHCDQKWLNQGIKELVHLAKEQDANGIKSKLKEIIPEYQPFDTNHSKPS